MQSIHLLQISLEQSILNQDFLDRQRKYANKLSQNTIIVLNPRKRLQKPIFEDKLKIFPTNSFSRLAYLMDAIILATKIHRLHPITCITTQDPIATATIGIMLKQAFKLPLLIQCHTPFIASEEWTNQNLRNRLLSPMIRWQLNQADTIRVVSKGLKTPISKIAPQSKVHVAPIAIQITDQAPARLKKTYLKLITVARLSPEKNLPSLINAFKEIKVKHKDSTLTIVGNGPQMSKLVDLSKKLHLNKSITFSGKVSQQQVISQLNKADIYVSPSLYEGWGRAIAEAMACGLPVVSTPISSVGHLLLSNQTAIITKGYDVENIKEGIEHLIINPKKAHRLAVASQRHINKIQKTITSQNFLKVIHDTVKA